MINRCCQYLMLLLSLGTGLAYGDTDLLKKPEAQAFVNELVKKYHFDRQQIQSILAAAEFQPKIIESMERPYEKQNWDRYQALFLTPERISKGLAFWQKNQDTLRKVEQSYGVPASIIVSILGVETLYGERQGSYRVLDALSTLAFYYPKRAEFFKKELREFLLLCNEQSVPATAYVGSYAGAIGMPQFMPSSYRNFAVDYQQRGKRDLMHDQSDVIASIANYLRLHGWVAHKAIAIPAQVKGSKYQNIHTENKKAEYSLAYLRGQGIAYAAHKQPLPKRAGLIELLNQVGKEYWLAFPNFYVITRYNSSPQYALAVHLLAEKLEYQRAQQLAKR